MSLARRYSWRERPVSAARAASSLRVSHAGGAALGPSAVLDYGAGANAMSVIAASSVEVPEGVGRRTRARPGTAADAAYKAMAVASS